MTSAVVTALDNLIREADTLSASDIHLDPTDCAVRVRFRVDGVLLDRDTLDKSNHTEIISRIKVLARLRTDEHGAAQDGRFRHATGSASLDIRVSIMPTYHGENAVLRLLSDKSGTQTLDSLGFEKTEQQKILQAIKQSHGMLLVTGPTGSGKTTTLYSLIKLLNTPERSIITIEDPIEYSVPGVRHIQVNPRTGLTFASGLRAILRQDPNIIMIGEIRDKETAQIAVNAALTGHLVLSTLHTNDAAGALPRLADMGVEDYLLASTLSLVIGQRLVRKICTTCRSKGCEACVRSGFSGRIAVSEVLTVSDDIRALILAKSSSKDIRKAASGAGMITLADDAAKKVSQGLTTQSEIVRVFNE